MQSKEMLYMDLEKGRYIYKVKFIDTPMLSYLVYEDNELCFSIEKFDLTFRIKEKHKIELNSITDDCLCKQMLEEYKKVKQKYDIGVKENNPSICTCYHNKRDLVRQANKIIENDLFDAKTTYKYLADIYLRIEDCHREIYQHMKTIYEDNRDDIQEIIFELLDAVGVTDNEIIVYRGFNPFSKENGTSFTLDYDTAKWFAKRWDSSGYVNKYKVSKTDVLMYLDQEKEIVTDKAVLLEKNI